MDEYTKLIPSFIIGKRTREVADMFCEDLAGRLVLPELHEAGLKPRLSTDGFNAYPGAIDAAFAGRCDFGVIIKDYQENPQPGRYGPPDMVHAVREVIYGRFNKRGGTRQPDNPDVHEAVYAAVARVQQEAG